MQYHELGRSALKVSVLGLGTMSWGEQNTEAEAHAQLDAALDAGINFVDTAEMYPVPPRAETHGLTERYIGSWLRQTGRRQDIVLATKAVGPARPGNANLPYARDGRVSYTRANLFEAVETSLQRLQTDYIDLFQLHWPDRSTNIFELVDYQYELDDDAVPILETLEALDALVKSGRVRHIGLCNETPWGLARFLHHAETLGLARVISIQNPYNLLNLDFENGLAEMALREQVGLLAYSPLAMGTLTGKYLGGQRPTGSRLNLFGRFFRYSSEWAQHAALAYTTLFREHGIDPVHGALSFVRSRPFVASTLVGATSVPQLQHSIASLEVTLSREMLDGIQSIYQRYGTPVP
ncbi:NADP(H)-dependent aldo-keto reductase [Mesorhizobium amorphae]|uniref:Protein tas n=1 Tax=Mesorhizobium amorphae CCNWGS0123 TaxID=1082933 RepID=G6Y8A2_9HYPH|nr:NADP(H)-dependent aldo-keto reductase [Mesorhizobium amorphae]ANT54688.1 aldo/keto reductase [Mesorhizobium amorphae CCNWGS0123]EHH12002.1 aryl-alcohol dehydrogenase-like oxidoreductase [Mesorhizobium amorphae CCNWGS0123]